jgi:hypothetical protein
MISIVVCSVKTASFNEFSGNVASTVGVLYEIIRIDNSGRTEVKIPKSLFRKSSKSKPGYAL